MLWESPTRPRVQKRPNDVEKIIICIMGHLCYGTVSIGMRKGQQRLRSQWPYVGNIRRAGKE